MRIAWFTPADRFSPLRRTNPTGGIREFLKSAGRSLERFHYYNRRDIDTATARHLVTMLGYGDSPDSYWSYGHLDPDGEVVWLGICVAEKAIGRGHGSAMMKLLIGYADMKSINEVTLGVAVDNVIARIFFEKFGFIRDDEGIDGHPELIRMVRRRKRAMDTIGSLVDKLATVNQKLFISQEVLYEIRRMKSFDEFKAKYLADEDAGRRLWEMLQKTCDLNVQRAALVTEVDQRIVEMIEAVVAGKNLDDGANIQRPHKTY
jgi:ribosomal protein S18 acetylase RimI-like enzyme